MPSSLRSDRLSLSERNASAELAAAWCNRDAVAQGCIVYLSEIISSKLLTRKIETWVIESVDKIGAHFQLNSFRKAETLGQGQIKNCQAWPS